LESEQGNRNETLYISEVLDKLTNFAQINDVLVVLMAHPTKLPKTKDGRIEAPTLYDISGSANFFNKADFGIVVHRRREENYVEIHVQKVKFRHLGEPGMCTFKYNINNGRYTPFDLLTPGNIIWDNENHLVKQIKERVQKAEQRSFFDLDMPEADCPF
jgi:twinkle protein